MTIVEPKAEGLMLKEVIHIQSSPAIRAIERQVDAKKGNRLMLDEGGAVARDFVYSSSGIVEGTSFDSLHKCAPRLIHKLTRCSAVNLAPVKSIVGADIL